MTLIDPSFLTSLDERIGGLRVQVAGHPHLCMLVYRRWDGWVASDIHDGARVFVEKGAVTGVYPDEIALERMTFLLYERGIPLPMGLVKIGFLPKLWECYRRGDFLEKTVYILDRRTTKEGETPFYSSYGFSMLEWRENRWAKRNYVGMFSRYGKTWGPDSNTETFIGEL